MPGPDGKTVMHKVVSGDTLGGLAKKHGTTIELIKKSNNLSNNVIRIGQELRIWTGTFNIFVDKSQNILMLKSEEDDRSLPIFIGVPEAQAIAIHLNGVSAPRPMTHDLLKNVLDKLETKVVRVEVTNLEDGTFYGQIVLAVEDRTTVIDSRPSDAIALALRSGAQILVAEHVMDAVAVVVDEEGEVKAQEQEPEPEDPVVVLERDLAQAIAEERYEDAATLRDQLKQSTQSN